MAKKGRLTKRHLRDAEVNRRQALARLGLGVSIAYAAPVLLSLSKAAASSGGSGSGGSGSGGSGSGGSGSGGSGSGGSGSGGSGSGGSGPSGSGPSGSGPSGSGPSGSGGGSGPAQSEELQRPCDEEYPPPWCPAK